MQIKEVLQWGHEHLLLSSNSARLDAELLLACTLKKPVTFLLAHDDSEIGFWQLRKYRNFIEKRKEGIPVAYLTGRREFFGLDFEVNKHVLVPRPDTEILASCVIEYLKPETRNPKPEKNSKSKTKSSKLLLDIGTGSACIPISILKNISKIHAVATEISKPALGVARRNIRRHELEDRITLIESDLLENVPANILKKKDVVVTANLPYIPKQFKIDPSTKFEPDVSLYGGGDGLDIYKRLIKQLSEIKPRAIFLECFEFQKAILVEKMPDYELKYAKNMTGEARCLMLERE